MSRDPFVEVFEEITPGSPTPEEARHQLVHLMPRYRRARTRHRLRVGVATGMALAAVAAGTAMLVASVGGDAQSQVDMTSRPDGTTPDAAAAESGTRGDESGSVGDPESAPRPDDSRPGDVAGDGTEATRTEPGETKPAGTEPTDRRVEQTAGGSATVELLNGRLVLAEHLPADGFTSSIESATADEIEVEFRDGTSEYKLRFEIRDGAIEVTVTGPDGSAPDESSGDQGDPSDEVDDHEDEDEDHETENDDEGGDDDHETADDDEGGDSEPGD